MISIDDRADDAYEDWRQREIDDAAEVLRAHEAALRRQQPPVPQPCHHCSTPFSGTVCPTCKEERPAFTALKAASRQGLQPIRKPVACRYFPESICGCDGRAMCVEPA